MALYSKAPGERDTCLSLPQKAQRPGKSGRCQHRCSPVTSPLEFSLSQIQILPCCLLMALSGTCHVGGAASDLQA